MKLGPDVSLTTKTALIIDLMTVSKCHSGVSRLSLYFSLQNY